MTENDAKTKWCPMVHFVVPDASSFTYSSRGNRLPEETGKCLGSGCAMWRVDMMVYCGKCHGSGYEQEMIAKEGETYKGSRTTDKPCEACNGAGEVPDGYCGLAGKP